MKIWAGFCADTMTVVECHGSTDRIKGWNSGMLSEWEVYLTHAHVYAPQNLENNAQMDITQ